MALPPWNDLDVPGDAGGNAMYQLSCSEVSQARQEQVLQSSHQSALVKWLQKGTTCDDPCLHHVLVAPPSLAWKNRMISQLPLPSVQVEG